MTESFLAVWSQISEVASLVLFHSLWQAGLVAATLAVTLVLLRRSDARLRYALTCLAMATFVGMVGSTAVYIGAGAETTLPKAPSRQTPVLTAPNNPTGSPTETGVGGAVPGDEPVLVGRLPAGLVRWFFPIWSLGVVVVSLLHWVGCRRARRLKIRGTAQLGGAWAARFVQLCETLKINRPVALLSSTVVHVPCVIGWLKPAVLVPVGALVGLSSRELEMILVHELAHVRRHDILVNGIQTVIETLFFFNPAIWWISRQVRREREHVCDDLAVASTGDQLAYARALAHLEHLRNPATGFAVAAGGACLMTRIRRLLIPSTQRSRLTGLPTAGLFAIVAALALTLGPLNLAPTSTALAGPDSAEREAFEPNRDDIRGDWELRIDGTRAQLAMDLGRRWRSNFTVRLRDLTPEIDATTTAFRMMRDAGTFHFLGEFRERRGELRGDGECYFRANAEYEAELERLGFRVKSDQDFLMLASQNVTLDFVHGLEELGYDNLSLHSLIELHILDVTPEFIAELADLGYRDLSVRRLIEMSIHDVHPDYVRALAELGYTDLKPSRLVEMRIHDVHPEYVAELQELGYSDISPSRLVEMSIHDVTPAYVRKLKELGYKRLKTAKLVEMSIHDVTTRYIRELAELGYGDISPSRLVEMRIHDVTASYVRKLQRRGLTDLTTRELVEHKIHDL